MVDLKIINSHLYYYTKIAYPRVTIPIIGGTALANWFDSMTLLEVPPDATEMFPRGPSVALLLATLTIRLLEICVSLINCLIDPCHGLGIIRY